MLIHQPSLHLQPHLTPPRSSCFLRYTTRCPHRCCSIASIASAANPSIAGYGGGGGSPPDSSYDGGGGSTLPPSCRNAGIAPCMTQHAREGAHDAASTTRST